MNTLNSVMVDGLSVKYGDFYAVKNISFTVKRGEIFGFLGSNGAGKTSTIKVLCGVLRPTSGRLAVNGENYGNVELLKRQIGYMSQKFTLYDDLTVFENLEFNSKLRKMPRGLFKKRIDELLGFIEFNFPLGTMVGDLPGGIKQQVSLVVSMLHDPDVIFLDEPTAGVTPYFRDKFWRLIKSLVKKGKTIFVTTHYMDEAENCDRIALMRAGEIIELDTPSNLKNKTFPEPMIEISQLPGKSVIEDILTDSLIMSSIPFGSRYHAVVQDEEAVGFLINKYQKLISIKRIKPSLEDVFVRLVEGHL